MHETFFCRIRQRATPPLRDPGIQGSSQSSRKSRTGLAATGRVGEWAGRRSPA